MSCWFSVWVCPLMSEVLVFYYYGITINSRLVSLSVCFMCLCDTVLGVYMLLSAMSFSCMDPFIKIFYNIFFVFCCNLCFKVHFVWYEYFYSHFLVISVCMKYLFPSPTFQPLCSFFCPEKSLLGSIEGFFFFFFLSPINHLHLLIGGFSPLTFLLG